VRQAWIRRNLNVIENVISQVSVLFWIEDNLLEITKNTMGCLENVTEDNFD